MTTGEERRIPDTIQTVAPGRDGRSDAVRRFAPRALALNGEEKTHALLEGLLDLMGVEAPTELAWGVFPGDGTLQPLAPGTTSILIREGIVRSPLGDINIVAPESVRKGTRSAILLVDSLVAIELISGTSVRSGQFLTAGTILEAVAKDVEQIVMQADTPYNCMLLLSTSPTPSRTRFAELIQGRYTDITLIKANVGGVADPLTELAGLPFVARYGFKLSVPPGLYVLGTPFIRVHGWPRKTFGVRNLDAVNSLDVQIFGGFYDSVLNGVVTPNGWIADPATPAPVVLAPGASVVLVSATEFGMVQLRARVNIASAAGSTARVIVEYAGIAP